MKASLNAFEKRTVDDLLSWDRTRRKADLFAAYFALVLGGVIVVAVSSYTVAHLQDQTTYALTRAGFGSAIGLFFIYVWGADRAAKKHQLATIIRKLTYRTADAS